MSKRIIGLIAIGLSIFTQTVLAADNNQSEQMAPQAEPNLPTVSLTLKREDQRIYAYVLIQQETTQAGRIRVDWTPPQGSSCDTSSYILPYRGLQFHTRAYRTLSYTLINGKRITCAGHWQAEVKDLQGNTLASATLEI